MANKKRKSAQHKQAGDDTPKMKQVLVGGPLLGSRQRNIASDFAAWDQFEPIITPEIQFDKKGERLQRFVLLPHSSHITILAYQTGTRIASFVPSMDDEESKDTSSQLLIETVCLAKYSRKLGEKTVQDVLKMEDESDDESATNETLDQIVDEVVVMVGCRDGSVREFSLRSLEDPSDTKTVQCGSYHIAGPCHRPRRVIRVTKKEPIMHITAPPLRSMIQEDGILTYVAVRTKDLDASVDSSKNEKSENMNVTMLRVLIPYYDGNSRVSLIRKEKGDIQRKWQLDKFRCRVGKDKVGGFMNTVPFRLASVAKPVANDCSIFVVVARANAIHVYYDQALTQQRHSPMIFPMPGENPLSSINVSTNNDDIACGHYFGEITVMNGVLSQVETYHKAMAKAEQHFGTKTNINKPEDPRTKYITSKAHWHAHSVGSLVYDSMSSPIDPILYSGGTESVLVTWQMTQGRSKPLHFLPRVSLGAIIHIASANRVDDRPANGILVYSDDNSLQLIEAHSKGRLWKIQGLACKPNDDVKQMIRKTTIEVDPLAKGAEDAQIVVTGLPEAPGFMHWYDASKRRLTASLEIAPFNRVSKTEVEDDPMPVPAITNHAFCGGGKELITLDETPTENVFVGAYDNQGQNGSYGVVTSIKFWAWDDAPSSKNESVGKTPYTLTAAMSFPHGPKNRVSALAASKDGSMACTVSNDEKAFRLWKKVVPEDGDETKRMPAWTCQYKVTIPAGFSNFSTRQNGVAFSDDGSTLALSCGNMVTLWDCSEARFLTSLRHLEGVSGTIDTVKFISSGPLQDVLLIKSDQGVSFQSPFGGRGGFKGWSWGVPLGVKSVKVSSVEFLETDGCVAMTVFHSKNGRSQLILIDAVTGKPGTKNLEPNGPTTLQDIEGRIISMSAAGKRKKASKWGDESNTEGSVMRLYSLASNGNLSLFTTVDEGLTSPTDLWKDSDLPVPSGPTLTIPQSRAQKRKQYDETAMVQLEPISKKSALELFGLVSSAENKSAAPSTSELPSLSRNFVRAFVGRRLLQEKGNEEDN
jgi:WD40 repeat protein